MNAKVYMHSKTGNRIDWIDIAKCIGLFLVIHNIFEEKVYEK